MVRGIFNRGIGDQKLNRKPNRTAPTGPPSRRIRLQPSKAFAPPALTAPETAAMSTAAYSGFGTHFIQRSTSALRRKSAPVLENPAFLSLIPSALALTPAPATAGTGPPARTGA